MHSPSPPPLPCVPRACPQRDFARVGAAANSILLPAWRQQELQAAAAAAPNAAPAQLLVKPIVELDASVAAQPGKRIGF